VKCEARMRRLETLNSALIMLADESWSASDPSTALIQRLKQSPFFTAIRGKIASTRKTYLQTNSMLLSHGSAVGCGSGEGIEGKEQGQEKELSLSSKAAKCSDEAAMEFRQLRALESQAEVLFLCSSRARAHQFFYCAVQRK